MMATAWAVYQLTATAEFHADYSRVITDGACKASGNLLPNYWTARRAAEIPAAALNGAALLLSAFLTYRMIKLYNWATFRRIGANRSISRIYKVHPTTSLCVSSLTSRPIACSVFVGCFAAFLVLYRRVYGSLDRSTYERRYRFAIDAYEIVQGRLCPHSMRELFLPWTLREAHVCRSCCSRGWWRDGSRFVENFVL